MLEGCFATLTWMWIVLRVNEVPCDSWIVSSSTVSGVAARAYASDLAG